MFIKRVFIILALFIFAVQFIPKSAQADTVSIDIKPQSCPNLLNIKSKEVLPVAILGMPDFDVRMIDITSLRLNGIAPVRSTFEDVTTPTGLDPCDCLALSGDGSEDLILKFNTQAIVATLDSVSKGLEIPLTLTGVLMDGTAIEGSDCVVIKGVNIRAYGINDSGARRPVDDDNTAAGVIKRLGKVGRILTKASARLDKIDGSFSPPPDDIKPAVLAALTDIKAQANVILTTADELERKTSGDIGGEPDD